MGSTGSGKFGDYPSGSGKGSAPKGGGGGSTDPNDRCLKAFVDELQDVEHSAYFQKNSKIPPVGTKLKLVHQKRIVAVDQSGLAIGNLPTGLNYIADCLAAGFEYVGEVTTSVPGSISKIVVSFTPVT